MEWLSEQGKKVIVQVACMQGDWVFISGVNGPCVINDLEGIEEQLQEDLNDMASGDYLFKCYYEPAQIGEEGRTEIAAYWQMDQIAFRPFPVEQDSTTQLATEEK